ncbi:MAG: hypothetical protein WEC80_02125 [Patescibacteria group bacterium]
MTLEATHSIPPVLQNPELFVPGTLDFKSPIMLSESAEGALFRLGEDNKGEFYAIKSFQEYIPNLIIHHRKHRRDKLPNVSTQVDFESILSSLETVDNDISHPEGVDPLHRNSQEVTKAQWTLISQIIDPRNSLKVPRYFLEVGLRGVENDDGKITDFFIDGLGFTQHGLFVVGEHSGKGTPPQRKYRQDEAYARAFKRMYGQNLPVNAIVFFHKELSENNFFLKIGYANQSLI